MTAEKEPEEVLLPQTTDELDDFVDLLVEKFGLSPTEDTYEDICTIIMQMPAGRAWVPLSYVANFSRKLHAQRAAYKKIEEFNGKRKAARAEAEAKAKQEADSKKEAPPVGESIQNP